MADTVDGAIEILEREGITQACEVVEGWAKEGRWQDLVALAGALEERCPVDTAHQKKRARFEAVADHIEDQLALIPATEAVDALLALSLRDRERSVVVPRTRSMRVAAFASRLGYGQTPDALLAALDRAGERPEHQELFACWIHEVVLRGRSFVGEPRAERFCELLAKSNHPLAVLPLELRNTEREAPSYMPLYGEKGLGRAIDTLASGAVSIRTIPPPADGAAVRVTELTEPSVTERMCTAVRPWTEGRSGRVEAKLFSVEPAVAVSALGSWLVRALRLESTDGVARLDCSRMQADGVFGLLFSAASNGGAYSPGLGGAYGRLAAWTSLGALVGAPEGAGIEAIDVAAANSAFLSFRAPGPWFHDVAWDLGVLVLRADGRTVAVLAATDNE
jgi:hypothetical protein